MRLEEWPIEAVLMTEQEERDMGDIGALAANIVAVGLLQPPVVLADGRLVAGHRRLAALRSLNRSTIPVLVRDGNGD